MFSVLLGVCLLKATLAVVRYKGRESRILLILGSRLVLPVLLAKMVSEVGCGLCTWRGT